MWIRKKSHRKEVLSIPLKKMTKAHKMEMKLRARRGKAATALPIMIHKIHRILVMKKSMRLKSTLASQRRFTRAIRGKVTITTRTTDTITKINTRTIINLITIRIPVKIRVLSQIICLTLYNSPMERKLLSRNGTGICNTTWGYTPRMVILLKKELS